MESTLSKIVLPYGVTVLSTTSGYMNVPSHKYKRGSAGLLLHPGPCKVQVSYAGPEQVEVRFYGTSGKRNTYGLKRVLEVIPSGGGAVCQRFTPLVPSKATGCKCRQALGLSRKDIPEPSRYSRFRKYSPRGGQK